MKKYIFLIDNSLFSYENYVDFILKNRKNFSSIFDLINEYIEKIDENKLYQVDNENLIKEFKNIYVKKFTKDYLMFYYPIIVKIMNYSFFAEYILNHPDIRISKNVYFFYKKFNNSDDIVKDLENNIEKIFPYYVDILKIRNNYFIYKNKEKHCMKKYPMKKVSNIVKVFYRKRNSLFSKNIYTNKVNIN